MHEPWWTQEEYVRDIPVPTDFLDYAGPHGVGMVRVWPNGKTDPGWGLTDKQGNPAFMPNYTAGKFSGRRVLAGYPDKWSFAFIMRSMQLVCIDIDGKNDGNVGAQKLMLSRTMAETSKSGDGYHLFYTIDTPWSDDYGFAPYADRIGIEKGVDIRSVGCVFHYPQQRWNRVKLTGLPMHLRSALLKREALAEAQIINITKILDAGEAEEVALMQSALEDDLAKPIPAGRRNNTLFAIGQQMKLAAVHDWEHKIFHRALDVGLDRDEAQKLVTNITKYELKP